MSFSPRPSPEPQALVQLLIRPSKCKRTHCAWSPVLLLSSSAPYASNWHHHLPALSWMPSFQPSPSWKVTSLFPPCPQAFSGASVEQFPLPPLSPGRVPDSVSICAPMHLDEPQLSLSPCCKHELLHPAPPAHWEFRGQMQSVSSWSTAPSPGPGTW